MKNKGYLVIGFVVLLTMIPCVSAFDFWWSTEGDEVSSSGAMVTTDPLPMDAECIVTANTIFYWNTPLEADAQCYQTEYGGAFVDAPYGHSFLQLGTGTPHDVDWGPCAANHVYTLNLFGEGVPLNLQIIDWIDGNSNNICHLPVSVSCEERECETAWAKLSDTCFRGTGNWGWYVMIPAETIPPGGSYDASGDLWAGAAKCDLDKGTNVGDADVTLTADGVSVDFTVPEDCYVKELHVWASNAYPAGPGFNKWYKSDEITFGTPLNLNKGIYLAVHTDTCCGACTLEGSCSDS